jgi:hypothetical protein
MDPKLVDYILANQGRYTREAIREELTKAGHDPAEIDRAWVALTTPDRDATAGPGFWGRFALYLVGANVAILLLVGLLTGMLGGLAAGGVVVLVILAVALAIGALISWGIVAATRPTEMGRTTAIVVGAVVPLVFALLIGGACFALVGGLAVPVQPARAGTLELNIEAPLTLDGSGEAQCFGQAGAGSGFSVFGQVTGTQGELVSLSVDAFPGGGPGTALIASLYMTFESGSEEQAAGGYASGPQGSELKLDTSPDGLSGTVTFDGLAPSEEGKSPSGNEPISGSVTWNCE